MVPVEGIGNDRKSVVLGRPDAVNRRYLLAAGSIQPQRQLNFGATRPLYATAEGQAVQAEPVYSLVLLTFAKRGDTTH